MRNARMHAVKLTENLGTPGRRTTLHCNQLRRPQRFAKTILILPPLRARRTHVQMFPQTKARCRSLSRAFHNFENPLTAIHLRHPACAPEDTALGFSLVASNARARCNLDRTVPTGHPMIRAASS